MGYNNCLLVQKYPGDSSKPTLYVFSIDIMCIPEIPLLYERRTLETLLSVLHFFFF